MTAASPLRVVVGGFAASMNKTFTTGLRPMENRPTALMGGGNAPLLPPSAASPPEGEICSPLTLVLT